MDCPSPKGPRAGLHRTETEISNNKAIQINSIQIKQQHQLKSNPNVPDPSLKSWESPTLKWQQCGGEAGFRGEIAPEERGYPWEGPTMGPHLKEKDMERDIILDTWDPDR